VVARRIIAGADRDVSFSSGQDGNLLFRGAVRHGLTSEAYSKAADGGRQFSICLKIGVDTPNDRLAWLDERFALRRELEG